MTGDYKILGASIDQVDLDKMNKIHSEATREIVRLGELLNNGKEIEDDILRLGRLLFEVGEIKESEYLLRRNIGEENDDAHQLYLSLHGRAAEQRFMQSVNLFISQFGVTLSEEQKKDYLCHTYQAIPKNTVREVDKTVGKILSGPCEVDFSYADRDEITASVTSTAVHRDQSQETPGAEYSIPLVLRHSEWIFDEDWQRR